MKRNYNYLLILSACLLLSSCNKYEDGPSISLRSRKARLVNKWQISEGSSQYYVFSEIFSLEFTKDGAYIMEVEQDTVNTKFVEGTWEFYDNHNSVITYIPSFTYRHFTIGDMHDTLNLSKLEHKEVWYSSLEGERKLKPFD